MVKIKLKNGKANKDESDYLYRWALECAGRKVDIGISYKELDLLKEKWRSLLLPLKNARARFVARKSKESDDRPAPIKGASKTSSNKTEKELSA